MVIRPAEWTGSSRLGIAYGAPATKLRSCGRSIRSPKGSAMHSAKGSASNPYTTIPYPGRSGGHQLSRLFDHFDGDRPDPLQFERAIGVIRRKWLFPLATTRQVDLHRSGRPTLAAAVFAADVEKSRRSGRLRPGRFV